MGAGTLRDPAAPAGPLEDADDAEWRCGGPVDLPRGRLADIVDAEGVVGAKGPDGGADFLVLPVREEEGSLFAGTVLAVRQAGAWTTFAVEDGGAVQSARTTADGGHQILVTMLSREGPGSSFTVMVGERGFASRACATIPFPETLNQPDFAGEFLVLDGLNGTGGGTMILTGSAERQQNGNEATEYYRYVSPDGGRSWSGPERLDDAPAAPVGEFSDLGPAPDLLAAFLRGAG